MSEENTGALAPITIVLNDDQQAAYDQIMQWLERRSEAYLNPQERYLKSSIDMPEGSEDWFTDPKPEDYLVLSGKAGVGKTFLLSKVIIDLSAAGWQMVTCAPTNAAVGVIQDKVREAAGNRVLSSDFRTLHSVCGLRLAETDDGKHVVTDTGQSELDQFSLAIIDEGSMIDSPVLFRAIQRSRGRCLIMIIGDPAQLPPVLESTVAKVFSLPQNVRLNKIVRQAEGNPLIAASMKIREKSQVDRILNSKTEAQASKIIAGLGPEDRVTASDLMEWLPSECMIRGVGSLRAKALDLQRQGVDARILCFTNKTVLSNNESLHFDLHPESGRVLFSPGERVIVQSACKAESLDTGKKVDLVTSEELVLEHVEAGTHPNYPGVKVYTLVMQDTLGNSVLVHTPKMLTAFEHECAQRFDEVNAINHKIRREGGSQRLYDELRTARGAAWGFKNAFALIRHSYSSTAWKVQGKTMDIALIDLPDLQRIASTWVYNTSLYVSLTRARHTVFVAY